MNRSPMYDWTGEEGGTAPPRRHQPLVTVLSPHVAAAATPQRKERKVATVVTGQEWHEGRLAMDVLRRCGYSWTQISTALGLDSGWARSAYDSKHVMSTAHLKGLMAEVKKLPDGTVEKTLAHLRGESVADDVADRLTTERVTREVVGEIAGAAKRLARAREIADAVRRQKGGTWDTVAQVFGYASGSSAQGTIQNAGDIGRDKLERAETWWTTQGPGRPAPPPRAPAEPNGKRPPAHTEPTEPGPTLVIRATPPRAARDTWDAIRDDALALAERIRGMAEALPLDGMPAALREEVRAAFQRRHDRLITWIEEELDG